MTEFRPLRDGELDGFLDLLCGVFDLELQSAKDLFTADPLYAVSRLWGAFEAGRIVACLTSRPLEFGWGRATGIAGVATAPDRRRKGIAGKLLAEVLASATNAGAGPALLFARRGALYERLGFRAVDEIVRGPLRVSDETGTEAAFAHVRRTYDAWAAADPSRLRRDEVRWEYWRWRFRETVARGSGYAALESGTVREAIGLSSLPKVEASEGAFLGSMATGAPFDGQPTATGDLLMGRGLPGPARLFLTDQF